MLSLVMKYFCHVIILSHKKWYFRVLFLIMLPHLCFYSHEKTAILKAFFIFPSFSLPFFSPCCLSSQNDPTDSACNFYPDRKLLHIITLRKTQFAQPSQIILQKMWGGNRNCPFYLHLSVTQTIFCTSDTFMLLPFLQLKKPKNHKNNLLQKEMVFTT